MPTATSDGVALHYETAASGVGVTFVGDVGYGAWLWSLLQPALAGPRQTLVWDLRGTGRSGAPAGPYDVDGLAADLEAVLADAGLQRTHLVGCGLGGMVALRHARSYGRARSLALFATPAAGAAIDEEALRALHPTERTESALRASLEGAFTHEFRAANPALVDRIVEWRTEDDADPEYVDAQIAAAQAFEAGPLHELTVPAFVGYGTDDPVVPRDAVESLADGLPRGECEAIEGRHLAFFEAGTAVTDRLMALFDRVESA